MVFQYSWVVHEERGSVRVSYILHGMIGMVGEEIYIFYVVESLFALKMGAWGYDQ